MKRHPYLILLFISASLTGSAQLFKIDTLQLNGDTSQLINVVFLGDGYTSAQQTAFRSRADSVFNYFMVSSPYSRYRNYFNAFAIRVISAESGAKHPRTASDCNTANPQVPVSNPKNYFGSTFDGYGIHRLVVPDSVSKIDTVLATHFPNYDLAIILVNSPYYGGSGGSSHLGGTGYPYITSTVAPASYEIALHESGHSFAGLLDEYWVGPQYLFERPNMTKQKNPASIKWKNWLGAGTGIGIFPFSQDTAWAKPANNTCRMEALGKPFCSVCSEAIIERVHTLTNPILNFSPDTSVHTFTDSIVTFRLGSLLLPSPNTLKKIWNYNGNPVGSNIDSFELKQDTLAHGIHTVTLCVEDTTTLVRTDLHAMSHVYLVEWSVNVFITGIDITPSVNIISCRVFPNPATDQVTVELESLQDQNIRAYLYALDGRLIREVLNMSSGTGSCFQNIQIHDLPAGTYILSIQAGSARFSKTIIKQ